MPTQGDSLADVPSGAGRIIQLHGGTRVAAYRDPSALLPGLATEVPQVSGAMRDAFRVVLLDEYQDTSAAQAIMLRGLFSGHVASDGRGHPVTAVGDPFQAIYGWRGAAASNIMTFAANFPRVDGQPARRYALTINRRSGRTILDVANALSRTLRAETDSTIAVRAAPADEGLEGLGLLQAPEGTSSGVVRAATFDTWPEEISWIGDQIAGLRDSGVVTRWADVAVLTRRNADIAPLYAELTTRDVPVEIVGLGGLLHLPEIMDITATLRLIDDVTANPDLIRLLTGPRWRVGPRDLGLLGRRARELARAAPERDEESERGTERGRRCSPPWSRLSPRSTQRRSSVCSTPWTARARRRIRRTPEIGSPGCRLSSAWLRRHGDEPVLDLTRRVITTIGLDVEVMATPEFAANIPPGPAGCLPGCGRRRTSMSMVTPRCPACSATCRLRASRVLDLSRPFPPTVRQSSCSLFTRPRAWNGRRSSSRP